MWPVGWQALEQWGDDVARIEPLTGGVGVNQVRSVRVNGHLAVGRLGARSDADLAWETELLQHLDPKPPQMGWVQEVIDRQVRQMVRLVDDLLDVSRITRGKIQLRPEPVGVGGVVDCAVETSRPLIDERKHRLTVAVPDD